MRLACWGSGGGVGFCLRPCETVDRPDRAAALPGCLARQVERGSCLPVAAQDLELLQAWQDVLLCAWRPGLPETVRGVEGARVAICACARCWAGCAWRWQRTRGSAPEGRWARTGEVAQLASPTTKDMGCRRTDDGRPELRERDAAWSRSPGCSSRIFSAKCSFCSRKSPHRLNFSVTY